MFISDMNDERLLAACQAFKDNAFSKHNTVRKRIAALPDVPPPVELSTARLMASVLKKLKQTHERYHLSSKSPIKQLLTRDGDNVIFTPTSTEEAVQAREAFDQIALDLTALRDKCMFARDHLRKSIAPTDVFFGILAYNQQRYDAESQLYDRLDPASLVADLRCINAEIAPVQWKPSLKMFTIGPFPDVVLRGSDHEALFGGISVKFTTHMIPPPRSQTDGVKLPGLKVQFTFSNPDRKYAYLPGPSGGVRYFHPHISSGGFACWGEAELDYYGLCRSWDLLGMAFLARTHVHSVNPGGAYGRFSHYKVYAYNCASCGRATPEGEEVRTSTGSVYCNQCCIVLHDNSTCVKNEATLLPSGQWVRTSEITHDPLSLCTSHPVMESSSNVTQEQVEQAVSSAANSISGQGQERIAEGLLTPARV